MRKIFFILTTISTIILGVYVYLGTALGLYNLHTPPQILVDFFNY